MVMRWDSLTCVLLAIAVGLIPSGCNQSSEMFTELDKQQSLPVDNASTPAIAGVESASATQALVGGAARGTGVDAKPETEALSPDQVCREFLACLQKADALSAERYLTKTSAVNARKAALTLESPGSPQAKFEFADPTYANSKKLVATVVCTVIDQIDGQASENQISWLLKRDGEAWKIAGMILTVDQNGTTDFFSFENPEDIQLIKQNVITQ